MKMHVLLLNAHACERFSLGCCQMDRQVVIIIRVYGKLTNDQIIDMVLSLDVTPELAVDSNGDRGA